jgi:hypothetical protein
LIEELRKFVIYGYINVITPIYREEVNSLNLIMEIGMKDQRQKKAFFVEDSVQVSVKHIISFQSL